MLFIIFGFTEHGLICYKFQTGRIAIAHAGGEVPVANRDSRFLHSIQIEYACGFRRSLKAGNSLQTRFA